MIDRWIRRHCTMSALNMSLCTEMYGHAALFHAIKSGQYEMVEAMIDRGANPHLSFALFTLPSSRSPAACLSAARSGQE